MRETELGLYVFYQFVRPAHWGNGAVPVEEFTERFTRRPYDGNPHYWLPL